MPKTFSVDVKQRFIEMRAKGITFNVIAEMMNVSKPTLIEWAKEFQCEIENARDLEMEKIRKKFSRKEDQGLAAEAKSINPEKNYQELLQENEAFRKKLIKYKRMNKRQEKIIEELELHQFPAKKFRMDKNGNLEKVSR